MAFAQRVTKNTWRLGRAEETPAANADVCVMREHAPGILPPSVPRQSGFHSIVSEVRTQVGIGGQALNGVSQFAGVARFDQ